MTDAMIDRRRVLGGAGLLFGGTLIGANAWANAPLPAYVPVAGHVKSLKFRMLDVETSKMVTEAAFRGHPTILYFGFTRCPDSCPLTMQNAARLVSIMGAAGQRLRVLFVTVDLDHDTAPRLKKFMAHFGKPPIFTGLRGSPAELKAAARRFGVFYRAPTGANSPDPVSAVSHSDATYLFSPDGKAVALLPAMPSSYPGLHQVAALIHKTTRA